MTRGAGDCVCANYVRFQTKTPGQASLRAPFSPGCLRPKGETHSRSDRLYIVLNSASGGSGRPGPLRAMFSSLQQAFVNLRRGGCR